jgi:hypothetical protein
MNEKETHRLGSASNEVPTGIAEEAYSVPGLRENAKNFIGLFCACEFESTPVLSTHSTIGCRVPIAISFGCQGRPGLLFGDVT